MPPLAAPSALPRRHRLLLLRLLLLLQQQQLWTGSVWATVTTTTTSDSEATLLLGGDLATSVMAPPGPPLRPHLTFVMADGERCLVSARHTCDSLYSHSGSHPAASRHRSRLQRRWVVGPDRLVAHD